VAAGVAMEEIPRILLVDRIETAVELVNIKVDTIKGIMTCPWSMDTDLIVHQVPSWAKTGTSLGIPMLSLSMGMNLPWWDIIKTWISDSRMSDIESALILDRLLEEGIRKGLVMIGMMREGVRMEVTSKVVRGIRGTEIVVVIAEEIGTIAGGRANQGIQGKHQERPPKIVIAEKQRVQLQRDMAEGRRLTSKCPITDLLI
jgi:hypothetical protein